MSKNLLIVVLFSVLIDVYRGECPVLMPCSQTHAAALSSLNSDSPNCRLSFSVWTPASRQTGPSRACPAAFITCAPDSQLHVPQTGRTPCFINPLPGTSLHLTPGDLRLLHDCSAFASCVPLNISPFNGADTCRPPPYSWNIAECGVKQQTYKAFVTAGIDVVGSVFKCIDAALLSCGVPKSIRTFFTSQKQKVEKLCNSDRIVAILPYFLTRLDEGDGLSALSSPGCVELMRCTGDGQSLRPGPQDTDTRTFCINIKIVNKCIDESKDSCAVASQFRSFIDHYKHEESEQCHSGVGVQSMTLTLVFVIATVTMVTRQLQ